MDDYEEIRQLLARYAHLLDGGSADGVAALFSVDGVFEVLGQCFEGRSAIGGMFRGYAEAGALADTRHLTLNSVISVDGVSATAMSDWIAIRAQDAGWGILAAGRYEDELVKKDVWLFRRRQDVLTGPIPPDATEAAMNADPGVPPAPD